MSANNPPTISSYGGSGDTAIVSLAENATYASEIWAHGIDQSFSYSIVGGADASKFTLGMNGLLFVIAPNFELPTDADGNNIYEVIVQVSDGYGGIDTQAIAVRVTDINEYPVITSNGGGDQALIYVAENTTAITTVTATDPDFWQTQALTYSIMGTSGAYLPITIDARTGVLSFSSAPDYEALVAGGGGVSSTVWVRVTDPTDRYDDQMVTVVLTNVFENTAPIITSNGGGNTAAISLAENTAAVTTVTTTDPDIGQARIYSITGGADAGKFTIGSSTGALSFVIAPNFELPTDAGGNNVYDVIVQASDGHGGIDTQTIAVTVTDAFENTAPVISSNGGGNTATISIAENTTTVTTVTATDPDIGQTLSYSIVGGADASKFNIGSTTGELSFIAAPNFEAPADIGANNVYDVNVQVSDGHGGIDTQAIAVTVSDINEAPVINSNGGAGTTTVSIAENTSGWFGHYTPFTTVLATDPDANTFIVYTVIGGADASKFNLSYFTGELSFVTAPNFEAPTDVGGNNVYEVIVQASDGHGGVDTQAIAVTVADIFENTAPIITSPVAVSLAENTTAVTTVTASDPDIGQTLSYSITGMTFIGYSLRGLDAGSFTIDPTTGALSFISAPDFEAPRGNVYDVNVQVSDGHGGIVTQAIAVTVTDVKDTPVTPVHWIGSVDVGTHPPGHTVAGTGDFNGDGSNDVLWFNPGNGDAEVWKTANGKWAGSVDIGHHPLGYAVAGVGDFNNDGTSDVLWYNQTTTNTEIWKISDGGWDGSVNIGLHPAGWKPAGIGDFDHNGSSDVLWFNQSTGNAEIWKVVDGQWAGSVDIGNHPLGYAVAGVGDFNADGTDDVLWFNAATGDAEIWKIKDGHWAGSDNIGLHPPGWTPSGVGDFNRDGTDDVLWYETSTGATDIWEINNGHWANSVTVGTHPTGWTPVGVGDLDHNAIPDITWQENGTGHIEQWLLA